MSLSPPPWRICVDTGGTFTDCVGVGPDGSRHRVKVLTASCVRGTVRSAAAGGSLVISQPFVVPDGFFAGYRLRPLGGGDSRRVEAWDAASSRAELDAPCELSVGAACELVSPEEAPVLAARLLTGTPLEADLPPLVLRLATTRGTNALLERRGAPTLLLITRGFADLLEIGSQQRPDLFTLEVRKPPPLYALVVEVPERLAADGSVVEPLDLEAVVAQLADLGEAAPKVAAVALLHSYLNPGHERVLAAALRERGFEHVSCSADLAPLIRILPRAETAVVDAYLGPVIGGYFERVGRALGKGRLQAMTSAGGLVRAADFRPRDSLLSGPAGGVVGAAAAARASGVTKVVAFDMGGTSTDVSRYDGGFEYRFETRVGDARVLAPCLAIETVAAGGGSICHFDGRQLKLGPHSAGADPGPACYGAGGPLTVTDVNLLLGRLAAERFPIPVRPEAAERAARELALRIARERGERPRRPPYWSLLEGWLAIANERMAEAIRRVSVQRGYDPAGYTLLAFGGAGGQHACEVADLLAIDRVLMPPDAGLLSAVGLAGAQIERFAQRQILRPLREVADLVPGWLEELAAEAAAGVEAEAGAQARTEVRRRLVGLRLVGQEGVLTVEPKGRSDLATAFLRLYFERFGYRPTNPSIEVESLRVVVSDRAPEVVASAAADGVSTPPPAGRRRVRFAGRWHRTPWWERADLLPGCRFDGPALVVEAHCVTVVEPGWSCRVDAAAALVLERRSTAGRA